MSDKQKMREALVVARRYAESAKIPAFAKAHILGLALLLERALAEQPEPVRKPAVVVYGDKIREDFEAWISAPPFEKSIRRLPMDEKLTSWPGAYRPIEVELAWEAWQAALAEQPAQVEAVAWCSACKGSGESTGMAGSGPDAYEVPCPCPQCGGTGASPPAPSVPDEMASSPTHGEYSSGFVNGWNHCRAAMLAASPEVPS